MKAYFLPLGAGMDRSLPTMLAALECGATRPVDEIRVLRVLFGTPEDLPSRMMDDLNRCHRYFSGKDAFAFFGCAFDNEIWQPVLPSRADLASEGGDLLLSALRGSGAPLSYRTDREAVEWALSALLDGITPETSAENNESLAPFIRLLSSIRADLDAGEEVRVLLTCDLAEGHAAGAALALLRFLRTTFAKDEPFIGLIAQMKPLGLGAENDLTAARSALAALRDRALVRLTDGRDTAGADAMWLFGMPSALLTNEDSARLTDWESARVMGEVFTGAVRPSAGLHTREVPGILCLHALGEEARGMATFLRGAFWCLSDLFPALHLFFDHPAPLRSLAPATRGGLFRRLFKQSGAPKEPEEFRILERALRALTLEVLTLIRTLPVTLREAEPTGKNWAEAVRTCGRSVTLASEYDVSRAEADSTGAGKVAPVHRVSMNDTEEEALLRKLDDMAADLSSALADRTAVFDRIGGFRARQALEDCRSRCRVAEVSAREKLTVMPYETPEEHFALGLQERRVRLLAAAVARCDLDLKAALERPALSAPGTQKPSSPFAGEILDPSLAELGFILLTGEQAQADTAARTIRDHLGNLLRGYPASDHKTLLKNLQSACRQPDPEAPLRSLMAGVFSVCGVETAGMDFRPAGDLPAVALLPDLTEEGRFFPLASAAERVLAPAEHDRAAEKRGALALMILRQYRRPNLGEASLDFCPVCPEDSTLSRSYLASRGADTAVIISLRLTEAEKTRRQPIAVILPEAGIELAKIATENQDLIPTFAMWFNREDNSFLDPCPYLSSGDRQILTEQFTRMRVNLKSPKSALFTDFLSDWHRDLMQSPRQTEEDSLLKDRLRVCCGLSRLPVWQKELRQVRAVYESSLPEDTVCAALCHLETLDAASAKAPEDVLYAFRSTPIARESNINLLESTHIPEADTILSSLGTECDILDHSSDDYHDALAAGLTDLLNHYPGADPDAVAAAQSLLEEAHAPITDPTTELTWPWDTVSASVLTILTECLGADLASEALQPFSEKLAIFPARGGEIIGDRMLSSLCVFRREDLPTSEEAGSAPEETSSITPDAVLPPLSHRFAAALCRHSRGQSLIQPGMFSFEPDGAAVRVTLTLEGAFTLRLVRVYPVSDQMTLYAHDLPTLALWPSVPFAPEDWHVYFSYAHASADYEITAVSRLSETIMSGSAPRFAAATPTFPLCYTLTFKEEEIGALPNLLPQPSLPAGSNLTACIDFGSAATGVILTDGDRRWPMQGPVTVRTILRNPAATDDLLWREFLPAVPVSALLPTALRIFRNDPADVDLPFRDGIIYMSASLRDVVDVAPESLYTDLKWNGEKGRAPGIYLHQVMLIAALQARFAGAASLSWRAAVPDEMAAEGREKLADTFRSLASVVSEESGLPLPAKVPPVAFASESAALGAYFRFCAPEQTRGGFLVLDLGADTADLSLHLRARGAAERSVQLPLGVHYMLLPHLLRHPDTLKQDFGFVELPDFQQDLNTFQNRLEKARRDPASLRQARYALDAFIADHLPTLRAALTQRRMEGAPGKTGALCLLHFSFLMMLSGLTLLQIAGESLRNDMLPDSMVLFMGGRGAALMEGLTPQAQAGLSHLLTMFRNPRLSSVRLMFAAEKKMEIPVGLSLAEDCTAALPRPAPSPVAIPVRPEELIPEFLIRFRREFPDEAALLFPGIYANDFYSPFSPYGQQLITQALQSSMQDSYQPYSSLTACLRDLLDMLEEGIR